MEVLRSQRDLHRKMVACNHAEYGDLSRELNWITEDHARKAENLRARYVAALGKQVDWLYRQTKPMRGELSPGCRICGSGTWSCLFINGKCNCRCFYCPTVQNEISVPTTNRLPFTKPSDYSDYVSHFDFEGVSISGGEPLLTIDRTLQYIRSVRRKAGESLHVWLYTNGTLLTNDDVHRLRDAGVNEIRFDISATGYDVKKIALAVGRIPTVTVEIPAIPEDMDQLSKLIPMLHDMGVNHLNLHHLRMTPHNSLQLKNRNYTFLHGEKVTVLDSELMALALLAKACERGWRLPINYCSFAYKHQYQLAATRKRNARFIMKNHESVTENGYIRSLSLSGDSNTITAIASSLERQCPNRKWWQLNGKKDQLFFHHSLWPSIDFSGCQVRVAYAEAQLNPGLSYHHAFKEIRLSTGKKLYVEKQTRSSNIPLTPEQRACFEKRVIGGRENSPAADNSTSQDFYPYEFIRPGLQTYF